MELGADLPLSSPDEFWDELGDRLTDAVSSSPDELDQIVRVYVTSLSVYLDENPGSASKMFKAMRKRWHEIVPVLISSVEHGGIVTEVNEGTMDLPDHGWQDRVGTAAAIMLYEVCRVQRLDSYELSLFTEDFIKHLFSRVEETRNALDETFNYTLIKLLIALNEQFMVQSLATMRPSSGDGANLPPPILPTIIGERKDPNLVLEVLKSKAVDSKTFGENIIFILNRSNGSADSLCVSLLILKLLYLLFTTSGTHEYFYTNDLCVLIDVFIRELNDLGDESEGLKHTYLRVLHPLVNNTQLRHHPYKRPQLRRVLLGLAAPSAFRPVDPTTKRLVERCLRGSWCDGLEDSNDISGDRDRRLVFRKESGMVEMGGIVGLGWSSGMGRRRDQPSPRKLSGSSTKLSTSPRLLNEAMSELRSDSRNGSSLSLVAVADAGGRHQRSGSVADSSASMSSPLASVIEFLSPLGTSVSQSRPRSSSLLSPAQVPSSPQAAEGVLRPSSTGPHPSTTRRRPPPPPPNVASDTTTMSPAFYPRPVTPSGRRAAPEPPTRSPVKLQDRFEHLTVS